MYMYMYTTLFGGGGGRFSWIERFLFFFGGTCIIGSGDREGSGEGDRDGGGVWGGGEGEVHVVSPNGL